MKRVQFDLTKTEIKLEKCVRSQRLVEIHPLTNATLGLSIRSQCWSRRVSKQNGFPFPSTIKIQCLSQSFELDEL